ncbi:Prolyl endopeptidase-like [Oopsacas minuta]|uniref:Prolyl endopeptidase n=1 Tax=Oopsacas minuta TaxID=111878 RepID=A0AAV7JEL4_9METZ|nr:Prolyl endopeptidase-like [Oopsacas minuta]
MFSLFWALYNTKYEPRRDTKSIEYKFNRILSDPYRWLEDPDSPETQCFVHEMNKISKPYLEKLLLKDSFKTRFTELYNYGKYGCPFRRGDFYYYFYNTGLQNQSVVYQQNDVKGDSTVFIDPNGFSKDGTIALGGIGFSKDGSKFAYSVSESGSDWQVIKIMDVATKEMYGEELARVKFSGIIWTHDHKGFFYCQYPQNKDAIGTSTETNKNMKLYYHYLNTPQDKDILCLDFPDQEKWFIGAYISHDGRYLLISIHEGTNPNSQVFYVDLELLPDGKVTGRLNYVKLIDNFDAMYDYVTNDGRDFTFLTTYKAPMQKLIRINIDNPQPDNWITLIPEDDKDLLDCVICSADTKLVVHYLRHARSVLYIHDLNTGDRLSEIQLPDCVSIDSITGRREDNVIYYKFSSFLTPGKIFSLDLTELNLTPVLFRELKVTGFDETQFEAKQVFYESEKDRTRIPMFIIHKKGLVLDGNNPTLLYGYGGFNISLTPYFSPSRVVWMQNMGGVFALPNIRGGGEYGENWHKSGNLENKQNVFDDFISAAQYLICHSYTSPDKLCVSGGSNGGLLVAVCANQRPELFKCIHCAVGVLDMLRFHKFTIGHAWIADYGDPDKEDEFDYIHKYSPLHNIPDIIEKMDHGRTMPLQYPSMLLTTGDHDDRVSPLHSLKFYAELNHKLRSLPQQKNPILIRIETKAGHGFGKPTEKVIQEYTEVFSFIGEQLNVVWSNN